MLNFKGDLDEFEWWSVIQDIQDERFGYVTIAIAKCPSEPKRG